MTTVTGAALCCAPDLAFPRMNPSQDPDAQAAAADGLMHRRYRALTTGIVALMTLIAFEYFAVATAMPAVARALDGLRLYPLAFGAPLAASVIGMVLSGHVSDRRGPALPLFSGVFVFVTGLLLAGAAPTMALLILGRLLQGLGGGMLTVSLYVMVARGYPPALHPRIFAVFAAAWVLPVIVGPLVAGLIVDHFGWRWVFLAAALLAPPAALLVRLGLPRQSLPAPQPATTTPGRIGWALGAAASAGLMYWGGQQHGAGLLLMALALAGLLLTAPPLLPAGTLRLARGLPTVVALRGFAAASFFACEIYIPLMFAGERGLSLTQAGLVLTVGALGWSAASWWQSQPGRPQGVPLLRRGMALIAGGILVVMSLLWPTMPMLFCIAGWIAAGVGMGLVFPQLSVLTLRLSEPAQQGRNSSALQLSDALFSTTALALSGALFATLSALSPVLAYALCLAFAALLGLVGFVAARRAA
ncbi:MAG TPA: MFS transporter [Ramlibacter sp.]|nr:MFS transporter [Ramlibacter sp.]